MKTLFNSLGILTESNLIFAIVCVLNIMIYVCILLCALLRVGRCITFLKIRAFHQYFFRTTVLFVTHASINSGACRFPHENVLYVLWISFCFAGSLKYVHQSCLQQWLTASETRSCELCKFNFIMHTKIKPFNEVCNKIQIINCINLFNSFCATLHYG